MDDWWSGLSDWFGGAAEGDYTDTLQSSDYTNSFLNDYSGTNYTGGLDPQQFDVGNTDLYSGNFPVMSGVDFNPANGTSTGQDGVWSKLANMLSMNPDTQKLVGQLAPTLVGTGTALASGLVGSRAGEQAGRDMQRQAQRIAAPSAQEQNIMNLAEQNLASNTPQSRSVSNIQNELTTVLAPYIEGMINQESKDRRRLDEGLIGSGMAFGGVLPQQRAYLQERTNKNIAQVISDAVQKERALRSGEAQSFQGTAGNQALAQQAQRQRTLMEGQDQATKAASAAGRAPMDNAMTGALIAQILSQFRA